MDQNEQKARIQVLFHLLSLLDSKENIISHEMKDLQIIEWKRTFDDSDKKMENMLF